MKYTLRTLVTFALFVLAVAFGALVICDCPVCVLLTLSPLMLVVSVPSPYSVVRVPCPLHHHIDAGLVMHVDVKDVGYVIVSTYWFFSHFGFVLINECYQNYDFPNNCEDYIHRIGRTGVREFCLMLGYFRSLLSFHSVPV